jgi:pyruvate,water dikinase
MQAFVVPLAAKQSLSVREVGCKAARLADMLRLGLRVPEGCVIKAAAFDQFCAANAIGGMDVPTGRLAACIRAGSVPAALLDELAQCLDSLACDAFAVRSSAVAEDGKTFSMAGQFDTYLNVAKEDVPEKVKACWAGMFGENVTAYAMKKRVQNANRMGVIIQRQITARYAGVLFTLDPVTRSADHFVVEWVEGLGEQLVSGAVTPERIYLNRRSPLVPKNLPEELRDSLERLVAHCVLLERHCNYPLDVEWASDASGLFLLQARPITAVTTTEAVAWTNVNMCENFPNPLTPFAWSIVDEFYRCYMYNLTHMLGINDPDLRRQCSGINKLTGVQGGRVYYNIKSWYELVSTYVPSLSLTFRRYLDHYIGQRVPVDLDQDHGDVIGRKHTAGPIRQVSFWSRLVFYLSCARHCLNRFERMFLRFRRDLRQPPYEALSATALMNKLDALFEDFAARYWYHQCIADLSVLLFPGMLESLVTRWVPKTVGVPDQVSAQLLQHIGIKSTHSAEMIWQMALAIGEQKVLQGLLESSRYAELENALPARLEELLKEFMERYGSRCYYESMIVSPTFEERHDLFWELVKQYQCAEQPRDADSVDTRDSFVNSEKRVLRELPFVRRQVLALALSLARRAIALREQGRMVQSLLFGEIRKLVLCLGRKLVDLGHLRTVDDVFYLHLSELRDLCRGKFLMPETIPRVIAVRREAVVACAELEPPEFFVLDEGMYFKGRVLASTALDQTRLQGVSASAGQVKGMAKVILDPASDERLEPGDILVTRSTDPGWTPLFMIAGGLVLERGGMLSHAAIVAREFGIPAVVGVEGATKRILGGEYLSVDGDRGEVVILDRENNTSKDVGGLCRTSDWEDCGDDTRNRKSA